MTPVIIAVAIFSLFSVVCAIRSDGFLEADSCTHYLYARFALTETHYLVNIWGRPLCTGIYMLPAYFGGRMGVRLMSLALALICAFTAYAIAKGQKFRAPALALIFTLAQPLLFLHSFSELTELPFAALIGLAFLAYQRRQFLVISILVALSPLARPEGFGFIMLAALALVLHRRWWWILILPVPLLLWDYTGWLRYGRPEYTDAIALHLPHSLRWLLWLKDNWPYAPQSVYEHGSIFHYLALMPAVTSPLIFPATCVGAWLCLRGRIVWRDHLDRCAWLIVMIPLLIWIAHSLLFRLGKMASSGELRYMLIVAPFWGVLSAGGWVWIFERFRLPAMYRLAGAAALVPGFVNFDYYQIVPITPSDDLRQAHQAADWFEHWPMRDQFPRLLASNIGVHYFLDISPTDRLRTREWRKSVIAQAQPGTIIIWDPVFGVYNSDATRSVRASDIDSAGWVLDIPASLELNDLSDPTDLDDSRWLIWRSPKSLAGQPTPIVTSLPWIAHRAYDDSGAK